MTVCKQMAPPNRLPGRGIDLLRVIHTCSRQNIDFLDKFTIGCPPVRCDNSRALSNGLSRARRDGQPWYTYIDVDLAGYKKRYEITHAKVLGWYTPSR